MPKLSDLLTSAAAVRNESAAEQNTALRVGNVLYFLAQYLQQYTSIADIKMEVSDVGVRITARSQTGDTTLYDKTIALPVANNEQAGILTAEAFSKIKADIAELQEAFTDLFNEKEELVTRVNANSENIATLDSSLQASQRAIANLNSTIDAAKTEIADNAGKISDISTFLDDTNEIADTATRILPFNGFVSNPTIEEMQGTPDYDSIVFDRTRGLFLAKKAGKYYNAFPGAEHYNKNMKARTDRLFRLTGTQFVYYYDGTALAPFIFSESDREELEKVAHVQELATQAKTDAARAQGTADSALSEAIEGKSAAANAFGAANNAQNTADAAQEKNAEQDERLNRIENNVAYLGIAGRYWDEDNATSTAENYYGSLQALRDLPKRLGLGRYLVTDDRKRKKLDPKDSTKYLDGTPAALDGSEGQCMWCWNGFYANIWHEGSRLIKAVTFDKPVGNDISIWIPAGGISWLGAGVMDRGDAPFTDRTKWKLCSLISDDERYRGGGGTALDASKYSKAPSAESPQITMLGMHATNISTTGFSTYARKRGEGWEANWFVARFVVEFLFEVIMGTENSQEAFNANKDADGLYQGGFGTGVTDMPDWGNYNGTYPLIPTSVGLEAGDGVCLVPYNLTDASGGTYRTFNVPVFFGLVGAGYGHLWQWVRGLIMDAGENQSLVYVAQSMYADYDPNTVADKILVAECPQKEGYIKRKSYQGLCCMPTEVGGTATTRFGDYFWTNAATLKGLRVRAAGGNARSGTYAGASCTLAAYAAASADSYCSAPLCYFEEDPVITRSQSIENNN